MDLVLEPSTTALVVIDLQRGITAMGSAPRQPAEVIARAARLAAAVRTGGGTVVLVHVMRSADGKDALRPTTDAQPAVAGSRVPPDWAEFVPEMSPQPGDVVITKRQWGAFYGTDLDLQLRRRGIGTIILCGISTTMGVESTARDAFERGYQQIFVEDAMAARAADDHKHTVESVFPRMGRVRSTEQVLAALE
jgi:nicotinamidase-related amidase